MPECETALMSSNYRAADIEVLSGLEPVRRRPGMYTDTSRPNHLAHEVVDNSVDEAIAEELAAYNPLIPDGANLKCTMMLEYPEVAERRAALARLGGIEHATYVEVGALGRVFAHADEDMPRTEADKTAAVHFLRFELDSAMRAALKAGAALKLGVDHAHYRHEVEAPAAVHAALAADLD